MKINYERGDKVIHKSFGLSEITFISENEKVKKRFTILHKNGKVKCSQSEFKLQK